MKRTPDPFGIILNKAADRLYLHAVWLGDDLRANSSMTLHALSTKPETFGEIRRSLTPGQRLECINSLLTAARAYALYHRKHAADAVHQGELDLPVA